MLYFNSLKIYKHFNFTNITKKTHNSLSTTHFCVGFEMETVTLLSTLLSVCSWGQCLFSGPRKRIWDWVAPEDGAEEEDEEDEEEEEAEEVRSGR